MTTAQSPEPPLKPLAPVPAARKVLLAAFAKLALSRRYRDFGVDAIVSTAGVARSTFYYHFSGKDDLLLHNLQPLIEALAQMVSKPEPTQELELWIAHIWDQRAIAGRLLGGITGRKLQTELVNALGTALAGHGTLPANRVPVLAEQIAGSSFALLKAWLGGRVTATPPDMTHALWLGARSLALGKS